MRVPIERLQFADESRQSEGIANMGDRAPNLDARYKTHIVFQGLADISVRLLIGFITLPVLQICMSLRSGNGTIE